MNSQLWHLAETSVEVKFSSNDVTDYVTVNGNSLAGSFVKSSI